MRKLHAVLIVLASALAALTLAIVRPAASVASSGPITPRLGYWIANHTDFVGIYGGYVDGTWTRMLCTTPSARVPSSVEFHSTTDFDARGIVLTSTLDALTRRYLPGIRYNVGAAAISQATLMILGDSADVARRARSVPNSAGVMRLARSMVAFARSHRGGYVLTLRLPTAAVPGQAARGTVTLHAAGGAPIPGPVSLTHSTNVVMPRVVNLPASGTASFEYRAIGWGTVRAGAHRGGLYSPAVFASTPTPGVQHMITYSSPLTVSASASFRAPVEGFGHSYACSSQCNGVPPVHLSACAPPSSYRSAVDFRYAGHVATVGFAASSVRTCHTIVRPMHDGTVVTAYRRYQRPDHSWTIGEQAPGRFLVDCPAAPAVGALIAYDCAHGAVTFAIGARSESGLALVPAVNHTTHREALVITGSAHATVYAAPGHRAVKTVRFACGRRASLTFHSAVQRRSGAYNAGHSSTITTP